MPETKIGQKNRLIREGNLEIQRQEEAYKNDLNILKELDQAMRKSDGTLKRSSKQWRAYTQVTENASDRAKEFGKQMVLNGKTLEDFDKKYKPDTSGLKDPVKWTTGLKSMASSAMTAIGNMAFNAISSIIIESILEGAAKVYSDYSNKQENAITKGNEALENYKSAKNALQQTTTWVNTNADRYEELSKGVTYSGENINLSRAEYEEYNQLSNQIAQYLPDQVTGYNQLGTAILGSVNSANELNAALNAEKIKQNTEAVKSATDIVKKFNAEMYQDKTDFTKESGITNQMESINRLLTDYDSGVDVLEKKIDKYATSFHEGINSSINYLADTNLIDAMENAGIEKPLFGYNKDTLLNEDNIKTLRNYYQQLKVEAEASASAIKEVMPAYLNSQKDYQSILEKTPAIDSMMTSIINNLQTKDLENLGFVGEDITPEETSRRINDWSTQLVKDLKNSELTKAYNDLFSLDASKTEKTYADYLKSADKSISNILKNSDAFTEDQLKNSSGVKDTIDDVVEAQKQINKQWPGIALKLGDTLTPKEIVQLGDISENFVGTYEQAIAKIREKNELEKYSLANMQENVTSAQTALSSFSSVLSETTSAGGLSADNISILKNVFSDLEDVDLNSLFVNTTNGVKLNIDALKNLSKQQNDMKSKEFAKAIELQNKAIAEQKKLTEDATKSEEERQEAQSNYEDALADLASLQQAQSQWQAVAKQQKELFSDYSAWQRAQSTENAGDKYLNMVTGLKNAKDAWDKGLVGTDDFKTFAAMISPTGSDDAKNFEENYAKAKRYLTDSVKGVKNFLNDLDAKGLAEFNDETKQWSYNIEDMAAAARKMGMGKDFMSAMFGRLEDYGFHNNFISSVDDGISKVNELSTALAKEEQNLAELNKYDPGNKTAIDASMEKIQQYKNDINEVIKQMSTVSQTAVEEAQANYEGAVNAIQALDEQRQKVLKSDMGETEKKAVYNQLTGQMNTLASGAGTTVEAVLELDDTEFKKQIQNEKEYAQQLLTATPDNPAKPDFGEDTEAAKNYESALGKVQEANKNNNETLKQSLETLSQYNSEQLKSIDLNDGAYDDTFEGAKEAEQALDNIVSSLGLSTEEAQMLATVLEAMGLIEPKVDTSQMTNDIASAIDSLTQDQVVTFKAQLDDGSFAQIEATKDEDGTITYTANIDGVQYEITNVTENQDGTITYTANIDGVETELTTVKDEEVTITYNEVEGETIEDPQDETRTITTEETVAVKPDPNPMEVETSDATVAVTPDPTPMEVPVKEAKVPVTPDPASVEVSATAKGKEDVDALSTSVTNLKGKTVVAVANVHGEKETYDLKNAIDSLYPRTVQEKANVFGTEQVQALVDTISSLKSKSVTITTNYVTTHSSSGGALTGRVPKHTGTMLSPAHASGTAYNVLNMKPAFAGGNVALQRNEQALVNEEQINGHSESIVRDGRWFLIPGGAHVENLKKGDLIFSAKQTDALLKYGKIYGHARAYAQGTLAYDGMPAHADTLSGGGGFQGGISPSKTANSLNNAASNIKKASSDLSSGAQKVTVAGEALSNLIKKISDNVKDWIEVLISRTESKIDYYKAVADNKASLASKNKSVSSAESLAKKEVKYYQDAYKKYMSYADSVASQVGLSESLKKQVQNGSINIQQLSEDDLSRVEAYTKWYEKALEARTNAETKYTEQMELAAQKLENITDIYDSYTNRTKANQDLTNAKLDYRETRGMSIGEGSGYYTLLNQQIAYENSNIGMLQEEYKAYKKELTSYGKKYGTNTKEYREMQANLSGINQQIYESMTALEEWKKQIRESKEQLKEWGVDKWNRASDKQDAAISYKQVADGYKVTEQDYKEQIKTNNNKISALYASREEKIKNMSLYSANSEEFQNYADELAQIDTEIMNIAADSEEAKNAVMDIRWKSFEDAQDVLDGVVKEYDSLRDLMDSDTFISESDGSFTTNGLSNLLLLQESVDATKTKIANYREQIENLNEQYANGCYSQEEYNEKLEELQNGLLDSAKTMANYKQEMLDLYEEQLKKKNDLLQEDISAYKEALDAKKKYHDYDRKLKSQTKELNILRSQAAALEGISDASTKARLAKIKAQIADAEDELSETKYQHEYELKSDGYDKLSDDVNKSLDKTLESLRTNTDMQNQVIDGMLAQVTASYESTFGNLDTVIQEHGLVMSDTFTSVFDNLDAKIKQITDSTKNVSEEISSLYNTGTVQDTKADETVTNINNSGVSATNGKTGTIVKDTVNNSDDSSNAGKGAGSGVTYVSASSVKLNKSSITLTVGKTYTLKGTVTPENAPANFEWSSGNTKIAKVSDSGVVTAVAAGSTTVTVKEHRSGKTASCKVTVKAVAKKPTTVKPTTTQPTKPTNNNKSTITVGSTINAGNARIYASIDDTKGARQYFASDPLYTVLAEKNGFYQVRWHKEKSGVSGWFKKSDVKKVGYAKGGIVDDYIPADMLGFLGKAVIHNGDSGVIGINPGEYVIPEEFARNMKPAMDIMKAFNENVDKYTKYNNVENAPVVNVNVVVEGNADANTVRDLNKFGKELANNKNFVDTMTGKISLNIAKDANKAGIVRKIR